MLADRQLERDVSVRPLNDAQLESRQPSEGFVADWTGGRDWREHLWN
jgi:hypothetical protein